MGHPQTGFGFFPARAQRLCRIGAEERGGAGTLISPFHCPCLDCRPHNHHALVRHSIVNWRERLVEVGYPFCFSHFLHSYSLDVPKLGATEPGRQRETQTMLDN